MREKVEPGSFCSMRFDPCGESPVHVAASVELRTETRQLARGNVLDRKARRHPEYSPLIPFIRRYMNQESPSRNTMRRLVIALLVAFFISGCTQQIRPFLRSHIGTERVFNKNYELGQKQAAYVGQPIIKVKDYKVSRFTARYMRASDDFVISGGIVSMSGDKNTDYVVRGETTIDGATYAVLNLPGGPSGTNFGALIKPDGSVHSRILNNNIVMVYTFSSSPTDLRFVPSKDEVIDVGAGYLNYELIYGGTDGKSITMTYREYTSNDLARPAFYQNLIYEAGKGQIRFREIVLEIHETTNERIVFTIISDGLTK